jgi:GntR family transcriptional regulator
MSILVQKQETTILNPNISTPLYTQLADHFRQMIESGKMQPGDRFPSEIDLAQRYGIARITVRKAIADLVEAGLLTRRQGKGTFITPPKIDRELVNVASFTDRMQARGLHAGAKTLSVTVVPATPKLVRLFAASEDAQVISIERLRLSNQEPVVLETSYLLSERCPGIEHEDLGDQSLYLALDHKYGLRPAYSSKTLELVYATAKESTLLNVMGGAPLFLMTAIVYSENNQVMEYAKILFRGDRFRFQVN